MSDLASITPGRTGGVSVIPLLYSASIANNFPAVLIFDSLTKINTSGSALLVICQQYKKNG